MTTLDEAQLAHDERIRRAERQRILALLREPSEELVEDMRKPIRAVWSTEQGHVRAVLSAIAAKIGGEG